jgi:hypothetical protein
MAQWCLSTDNRLCGDQLIACWQACAKDDAERLIGPAGAGAW